MELKATTITCEAEGERLDVFLSRNIPQLTRNAAVRLLDSGHITVNNKIVKKNYRTVPGDLITVTQNEPVSPVAAAQDIRLDVIYEDCDVIVINKPQGMVVHPAPGHDGGTLVNALLFHCKNTLSGIGGVLRPGIVHRIDKNTSGLIIAAKNDTAHLSLTHQLKERTLKREYDTLVRGYVKDSSGTINVPIGRDRKSRKRQAVYGINPRDAVTHYNVVNRYCKSPQKNNLPGLCYTHLYCRLDTGRTHQIRVHLANIGHPVLGDTVYGCKKPELGLSSQCLHSRTLTFIHPKTNKEICLTSPLPEYFIHTLEGLYTIT